MEGDGSASHVTGAQRGLLTVIESAGPGQTRQDKAHDGPQSERTRQEARQ